MAEHVAHVPLAERGARALGLDLTPAQLGQLAAFAAELLLWNRQVNLTAITQFDDVQIKHLVDSLSIVPLLLRLSAGRGAIIDVGSGAGFPGLVLAIALPQLHVTLAEATGKKVQFLQHVIGTLAIANAQPTKGRAEDLARVLAHREQYDAAVARAVGPISALVELLVPFLRVGGHAVLMKTRQSVNSEIEGAQRALVALSCVVEEVVPVALPGILEDRALVVVRKTAPTGPLYPRRSGTPQRRPL